MKLMKANQQPTAQAIKAIQQMEYCYNEIAKHEIMLKEMKEDLKKAMIENGIEKLEYGNVSFKIRQPYSRLKRDVNYEAMKIEGIYDNFVKESKTLVGASLEMKVK